MIYIGTFVRAYCGTKELTVIGCNNRDCNNRTSSIGSKFCPSCGSKAEEIIDRNWFGKKPIVKHDEVSRKMTDYLRCVKEKIDYDTAKAVTIWIPTISDKYTMSYDASSETMYEFSNSDKIEIDLKDFSLIFAKEIEVLKSYYEIVELRWGVVDSGFWA